MHARRRGIASSVRPFRTEAPEWSNTDAKEIEAKVVELRKTGKTCAQIGLVLRDKHGVPSVKLATAKMTMNSQPGNSTASNCKTPNPLNT